MGGTLGLILARGGSKRCPGKNIRTLGRKPLIVWTIMEAIVKPRTQLDRVVVSSDDDEILRIAREHWAETLKRPAELATDDASSYDAILHALDELGPFDKVCLLQPTSPFRDAGDIGLCMATLHETGWPAVVSCADGSDKPNGAIYAADVGWLREALTQDPAPFDGPTPLRYHMPIERSIDIDTEEDFARAEAMIAA